MKVDTHVQNVVTTVTEKVSEVKTSQIVNIVSKPQTKVNDYIITVESSEGVSTEIHVMYQKEQDKIVITNVEEKPYVFVKPKPEFVSEIIEISEARSSEKIVHVVEEVNKVESIPHINIELVTKVEKIEKESTTSYEITTETVTGN